MLSKIHNESHIYIMSTLALKENSGVSSGGDSDLQTLLLCTQ